MTITLAFAVACLVGGSAYAVAFMALSVFTSRAFLLGLAYVLIWEGVLSGLLEGTKFLSIRQATLGLAAALGADVPGDPLASESSACSCSRRARRRRSCWRAGGSPGSRSAAATDPSRRRPGTRRLTDFAGLGRFPRDKRP